jgi:hypothetical protein
VQQNLGEAFHNLECTDLYRRYETRLHLMYKRAMDDPISFPDIHIQKQRRPPHGQHLPNPQPPAPNPLLSPFRLEII